jgi:hypothetical protein
MQRQPMDLGVLLISICGGKNLSSTAFKPRGLRSSDHNSQSCVQNSPVPGANLDPPTQWAQSPDHGHGPLSVVTEYLNHRVRQQRWL